MASVSYCNARVINEMNSEHDSYLLSALFAKALLMIESKACGSQSILRESLGGGECSCSSISPIDVVAVNGGEPVINSKASAQCILVVAADGACPRSGSGAE